MRSLRGSGDLSVADTAPITLQPEPLAASGTHLSKSHNNDLQATIAQMCFAKYE